MIMDRLGYNNLRRVRQYFRNSCKVRQCFQCPEDTEFYCNTCKHDLCLPCKERHVISLHTKDHDVVIYREKYENITKQETCERHPDMFYQTYCHSCKLPVCFQCTEHRDHQIQDIKTAYKTNRQKHREIVHNIRSETLYNNSCILAGIKSDIKTYHPVISNNQSETLLKAQKLRNLIDTEMYDVKIRRKRFIQSLQKQRKHLSNIEDLEHRSEQLANRPLEFIMLLKTNRVHKLKDTPNPTQYALVCLTEEINIEDVTDLLGEIQIIERGERQVRNESQLKLMSTPVLHRSVNVRGDPGKIFHICCVTPDQVWISNGQNIILINSEGDILHHITRNRTQHTVNLTGDLIYIDWDGNILKLSKDNRTNSTLMKITVPSAPKCIYSSKLNGDLLAGMRTYQGKGIIKRFNDIGHHKQTIWHGNTGQNLYYYPMYITENRNGDVIVSDKGSIRTGICYGAVVVTDSRGRHRFSYTGSPSQSRLYPRGICTDALSNILVCDERTYTVQIIDKDGQFLSLIMKTQRVNIPQALSYDDKTHLLWVGSTYGEKSLCVYRHIDRQDTIQYMTNQIDI
ncbi:uncharacterized protein LOC134247052 [Saccostrea cucullata]|uniref:uncharacterized protein LOC134247052 n=1 Tax=Saccostrea cuccullata TaxID=36930 RepID=UPI002ED2E4B6